MPASTVEPFRSHQDEQQLPQNGHEQDHDQEQTKKARLKRQTFYQIYKLFTLAPIPLFPDGVITILVVPIIILYMVAGYFMLLAPGNVYSALVNEDWRLFRKVIFNLFGLTAAVLTLRVTRNVLRESISNQLRERMAYILHRNYFQASTSNKHEIARYYKLTKEMDNPDQRIVMDSREFCMLLTELLIDDYGGVIESVLSILLYSYSTYTVIGMYGILIAYLYTLIVFFLTFNIINFTSPIIYKQERLEASLRYEHSKIRRFAQQIVFLKSYTWELLNVNGYLKVAIENQWRLILKHVFLNSLQQGFSYYVTIIMYVSLAIAIKSNLVATKFGVSNAGEKAKWVSQSGAVFMQLLFAFTMLMNLATKLSTFVAVVERLYQLCACLELVPELQPQLRQIVRDAQEQQEQEQENDDENTATIPLISENEKPSRKNQNTIIDINSIENTHLETSMSTSMVTSSSAYKPESDQHKKQSKEEEEPEEDVMIELENVRVRLSDTKIIGPLSLKLRRRSIIHLKGRSGVGKTSVLCLIRGVFDDNEDEGEDDEHTISTSPTSTTSPMLIGGSVRRPPNLSSIRYLPQTPYLSSNLQTLRDIVTYPDSSARTSDETKRVHQCLRAVGWKGEVNIDRVGQWSSVLSNGEVQLLFIASILFKQPTFALLDEPTSALDAASERIAINALVQSGIALLIIGHSKVLDDEYVERNNVQVVHMI